MPPPKCSLPVVLTLSALADLLDPGQDGYHDIAATASASNNAVWVWQRAAYGRIGATPIARR
jgi:hypothetical protein